jgi:deaminated glutathione amidase
VKIAVLQMTSGIDPGANAATLVTAVREAAVGGAAMLFTPEMSGLLDGDGARAAGLVMAEGDDSVLAAVREAAREAGIWVHLGSLAVRDTGDGRWANRAFVIDAGGEVVARYDKMHLFDVDLASGESWRESKRYLPGAGPVVVDTPVGRLGLSICYDMRFPALFQALSGAGAMVLAVPAAFTVPTGQAHWHTLLRARAIENACFLVAAAQTGWHEDGRATYGHSLVVDPWGRVLLDMGEDAGLGLAEIDAGVLGDVRARVPVLAHRREIGAVS